jgi:hypothetical protein
MSLISNFSNIPETAGIAIVTKSNKNPQDCIEPPRAGLLGIALLVLAGLERPKVFDLHQRGVMFVLWKKTKSYREHH